MMNKQDLENIAYSAYNVHFVSKIINYVIDSRYRRAINLKSWLGKQVEKPTKSLIFHANLIDDETDHDRQVIKVLKHVRRTIAYVGDQRRWKASEYWQTADETITFRSGDCEDGAILAYVLCRLKGVPANRLFILTGWVQNSKTAPQGGHAWLAYRDNYYKPMLFLDWCYYYSPHYKHFRNKFILNGKNITEFRKTDWTEIESKYKSIWFGFNEEIGFTKVTN